MTRKDRGSGREMYESDVGRIGTRKKKFEANIGTALGKRWKGNEWMKKATQKVWDENLYGVRAIYTKKTYAGTARTQTGGEGGDQYDKIYRGYGRIHEKDLNRLAHTMTTMAANIQSGEVREKESEKRIGEKKARGGMGSRGRTIMTGGHQGVLGRARTRRQTLMGREDKERGTMGASVTGTRRHKKRLEE